MKNGIFHWGDQEVLMTYHNTGLHRRGPDGQSRESMLVLVPVTFEDPNISLSDALRLLDGLLTKTSRNPRFDWVLRIGAGMGTVRRQDPAEGFEKGNWVAKIQCTAKYYKEYSAYLNRLGGMGDEEDEEDPT